MNIKNDFLGYQFELIDALQAIQVAQTDGCAKAVVDAVVCFGKCLLYGYSTQVANVELLSCEVVDRSQALIEREISNWADVAAELPAQWDATWQDDEAFLLCHSILELRTDAWAVELAFRELRCKVSDTLRGAITHFDQMIKDQEDILSTVVGSTWWNNQQQWIATGLLEEAWWLNNSLSRASTMVVREATDSIPSKTQWATIRSAALWNEALPALSGMAASTPGSVTTSQTVCWHSPCKAFKAVLMIPRRVNETETEKLRSLFVMRVDDESLATEFAGQAFSLGTVRGSFDTQATAKLRLADLMTSCNGQLFIGEPAIVWRIELELKPASSGGSP